MFVIACFFFVCLEFQIIRFVFSSFTPIFFIEISFVLLPPPPFIVTYRVGDESCTACPVGTSATPSSLCVACSEGSYAPVTGTWGVATVSRRFKSYDDIEPYFFWSEHTMIHVYTT